MSGYCFASSGCDNSISDHHVQGDISGILSLFADSSDGSCVEHEDKHEIRLITPHIRSSQVRASSANNTIGVQGVGISGPKTRRQSTKAANTASNPTERRQTGRQKSGQSVVFISDESDSDFETLPRKQLPSAAGKGNL